MLPIYTLDLFAIALFFISFFGLITSRNVIKSIIFILLMQTSVIMFWLFMGARSGNTPPIIYDTEILSNLPAISDPLPQALMLTAIIIGISVTAINITMLNTLFRKFNTTDWDAMTKLSHQNNGVDIADEAQKGPENEEI